MQKKTLSLIAAGNVKKGDVLSIARLAGIMGAKKTPDLIPLCHPLPLSSVKVDLWLNQENSAVEIEASVSLNARTGVEMEALTAVSIAALSVYDMLKAVEKTIRIENIHLIHKFGGKSGIFSAS